MGNGYWSDQAAKDKPEQVMLCIHLARYGQGCWTEFQDFWRMTWPRDSGINQEHETKEKSVWFGEDSVNKKPLGMGWGRQWTVVETPHTPPLMHYSPARFPPLDPGFCTVRALEGKPNTPHSTLPLHPFFGLKILIYIIRSVPDWFIMVARVVFCGDASTLHV